MGLLSLTAPSENSPGRMHQLPTHPNPQSQARHYHQQSHCTPPAYRGTATLATFKFQSIWLNTHLSFVFDIQPALDHVSLESSTRARLPPCRHAPVSPVNSRPHNIPLVILKKGNKLHLSQAVHRPTYCSHPAFNKRIALLFPEQSPCHRKITISELHCAFSACTWLPLPVHAALDFLTHLCLFEFKSQVSPCTDTQDIHSV